MLRALLVIGIIVYGCAKSVQGPFYALLFYLWIAYFRPEQWLWFDFYSQLNLSFLVGIAVLLSTLIAPGEKLRFGFGSVLMIVFLVQSTLSTLFSPHSDYAFPYYEDFLKCIIISLVIASLVTEERRLRLVFLVIVCSVGLEGVKQGWAQLLLNPGAKNANPWEAFGDENGVAVGMLMVSSMMVALARAAPSKWERVLMRFALVGVVYRAISTYSRGGFLSLGGFTLHYILRSKRKLVGVVAIAFVVGIIVPVLPDDFWARMNTINQAQQNLEETAEADLSIAGRLHFWAVAWEMAKARPLLGVGHNAYNASYREYDFSFGKFPGDRSVHSIWLGVLSELGFPGLIVFVTLILYAFWTNRRVQRLAKKHPELTNLGHYGRGIEGALVVYAIGGSFVIFQYHEFPWHLFALSFALGRIASERVAALSAEAVPLRGGAGAGVAAARGLLGDDALVMPAHVPVAARRREVPVPARAPRAGERHGGSLPQLPMASAVARKE